MALLMYDIKKPGRLGEADIQWDGPLDPRF